MKNSKIRKLVECAILIALGTVLSLFKVWEMPFGGSITLLSMLPVCLIGFMYGPKWGFGSAFIYSVFQIFTGSVFAWGLSPTVLIVCILADYIIAFTMLGITGFFNGKKNSGIIAGISCAMVLRLLCHYISGVTIWASSAPEEWNPWLWSIAYNGTFMLPELIFTLIGAVVIFNIPAFKRHIEGK